MVASAITTTNLEPVGISLESTARVQEFDGSTVTAPQLVKSLNRNGGVLIRNFVDRDSVAAIEQDVRPFINADVAWEGQFFPTATRRVLGLAQKSPVFTHKVIMHNLWQEVVDTILTTTTTFWTGQTPHPSVSRPQLSATAVFSIGPGAKAQELHRDDASHHNIKPATTYEGYTMGRESGIGLFVAGKKTTRKNGATRFVPGTHLDATKTPPPDEKADPEAAVYAEMEPGDAFMMLSSCYHGGSRNATDDEERLVFACFCVRGFLRQVSHVITLEFVS